MRHQDEMLRAREAEFLSLFEQRMASAHLGEHLRSCPIEHEWIDANTLVVALTDVDSINDFELRALHAALGVESHCTITPDHQNRLRVSFQCKLTEKPR
jgi:hypothetical protein